MFDTFTKKCTQIHYLLLLKQENKQTNKQKKITTKIVYKLPFLSSLI